MIFTCACITVFCSFSSLTCSFHSAAWVSNCAYTQKDGREREEEKWKSTLFYLLLQLQLLLLHFEAFLCFVNCFFKQLATKTAKKLAWFHQPPDHTPHSSSTSTINPFVILHAVTHVFFLSLVFLLCFLQKHVSFLQFGIGQLLLQVFLFEYLLKALFNK